ncbi:MAG: ATP synthase F1 subunit gamma [Methylotenera sp.]|nr:ATP synthase F1 subunit gamma [Oligoflexia bacterium]
MASIKDLKKRIGTVKNTQQTTRAMKMVSASKLRRSQDAISNQRPYARRIGDLINQTISLLSEPVNSPLIQQQAEAAENAGGKKLLFVVVTSDRGLCGGFNANIIKGTQRWVAAHKNDYSSIELAFVGRRGFDFFKTKNFNIGPYFPELGGKVTYEKARILSANLVELFTSKQVDEVKFIFNEFKNAVTQEVVIDNYLPLQPKPLEVKQGGDTVEPIYLVKPSPKEVLLSLLDKHFSIQAFRILLDSQASEHGSRMSAMENATKNAGEMIKKLTLQFNKQRQAGITKELLEIIAGSESQKG